MSHPEDTKKVIEYKSRRLQKLKERRAIEGFRVDPAVIIEIEDTEKEIAALLTGLKETFPNANIFAGDDGQINWDEHELSPPFSEVDPFLVEQFVAPGGAMKLRDKLYVQRPEDKRFKNQLTGRGTMTTIRAARQTGKSSLLVRGLRDAREQGIKVVRVDLQSFDREVFQTPEKFLRCLLDEFALQLRLNEVELTKIWSSSNKTPQSRLTHFLEDNVLCKSDCPIIFALDEADKLLPTDFRSDFFGLVRSWHNSASWDERWENLNIVLVVSTEPFLLIADLLQSPFNIGAKLYLADFNELQVAWLYRQHHLPPQEWDSPAIMSLLSGHPYLTRQAFYTMYIDGLTWAELERAAIVDNGPFSDHLDHLYGIILNNVDMREAIKQVLGRGYLQDEEMGYRLMRAGLIKKVGNTYSFRCNLYHRYFEQKSS